MRERLCRAEIMDQPGLATDQHHQALRGLERINRWSGSARILWPPVRELLLRSTHPVRLLDVATGAGDVPLRLWQYANALGRPLEIDACDRSSVALEHARQRAEQAGAPLRFLTCDALHEPLPGRYDVVTSSLFLHHLTEDEAVPLLKRMSEAAEQLLLINDLRRCRLGWWLAQVGGRLLSSSPVVHHDGPASVAAAFTCAEAVALAERAGLQGVQVSRRFPFRFLLSWRRA